MHTDTDTQQQISALGFLQDGANSDQKKLRLGGFAGVAIAGLSLFALLSDGIPWWVVLIMSGSGLLLAGICFPLAKFAGVSPVLGHLRTTDDPIVRATLGVAVFKNIPRLVLHFTTRAGVEMEEAVILSQGLLDQAGEVEKRASAALRAMQGAIPEVTRVS